VIVYVDGNNNFIGTEEQEDIRPRYRTRAYRFYKQIHSIQLPLSLGYEWQKNNYDLSFSGGPAINYYYAQSDTEIKDLRDLLNYDFATIKISAQLRAEVGYRIKDKWRLFAAIEGGRVIGSLGSMPIEETHTFKTKLSHAGARTGISYAF